MAIEAGAVGELLATAYYNRPATSAVLPGFPTPELTPPVSLSPAIPRAVLLRGMGRIADSLETYHHAVAVDPTSKRAVGNLCNLQRAVKQLDNAAACYIKLSKLQPEDGMTRALIGDALFFAHAQKKEKCEASRSQRQCETPAEKAKLRREVVKHLKAAVTLNPSLADVYANIGKMYEDGGQFGSARQM